MFRRLRCTGLILGTLVLLASTARAQSQSSGTQQPLPPVSPLGSDKMVGDPVTPGDPAGGHQQLVPDTRPLTGAQDLTLGSSENAHNFLLPSFTALTQVGSDPYSSTSSTSPAIFSNSLFTGRLGLNQISQGSEFLMDYIGGASFSNDPTIGNSLIQGLDLTETIHRGRWSVMFGDHFTYLSSSPFGFASVGGLSSLGVGLGSGVGTSPGISSSFTPSDSIYVGGVPRVENAVIGQTTYLLSHRSSFTVLGDLGTLNFRKSPLLDSRVVTFQAGYTYLLSRLNSISVLYRFDDFDFPTLPQGIHDNEIQLAFARQITGRLTWQVGGGPSIQEYLNPLAGPGTVVAPSAFTSLGYRLKYTRFSFVYSHGLTSGSGVLPGAETDTFTGRAIRTFGRDWESEIDAGYSRSEGVRQTSTITTLSAPSTWFATARISRRFVGYGALFVAYNASGQSSLVPVCTAPSCGFSSLTSTVSLGYTWGLRPVNLE